MYAKSEATGLLRKGWTTEEVLAAYCRAMAERIYSLVERLGVTPEFAITGGMAKNRGVIGRLMPMIGLEPAKTEWDTQIAGGVGAALFGYALCQKGRGREKNRPEGGGGTMLANDGVPGGSGEYFVTIDTGKCNGCRDCEETCPAKVFEVVEEDPNDPMREEPVAMVAPEKEGSSSTSAIRASLRSTGRLYPV